MKLLVPLWVAGVCCAQQTAGPQSALAPPKPAAASSSPNQIKIVVVAGEGSVNNVAARVAAQPVVEVRDENEKPVPGAEVIFQLPASGPSGMFFGWMRTHTVKTDAQGQAKASGLTPNGELGRFEIQVRATAGTKTAETVIHQSNGGGPAGGTKMKSSHKGLWTTLAILAATGAIGGGVAASRDGSTAPAAQTTKPVTIGAGPIAVGGPR